MALVNCPECGKEVSDSAKKCPHCGYSLKKFPVKKLVKILIIIATVSVVVCGIIAYVNYQKALKAAREEAENARIMHELKVEQEKKKREDELAQQQAYANIKNNLDIEVNGYSKKHIVGKVKNNSDTKVYFVEVKIKFYDDDGNVLDTTSTYAVGKEGLAPGETAEFDTYHKYSTKKLKASILDFNL